MSAVLAEQHDEWAEHRRYLGLEALKNARAVLTDRATDDALEEVNTDLIAGAINASPNNLDGSPSYTTDPDLTHLRMLLTRPRSYRNDLRLCV